MIPILLNHENKTKYLYNLINNFKTTSEGEWKIKRTF